jgi:predicted transcriptional regulator
MICGKGGMKTLTRHLNQAHQMKPTEYRKQFSIPKTQVLMSKSYSAKRKEIAAGMDLTGNLEKARAARLGNAVKGKGKKK